jgi:hypothetical protein
MIKNIGLARDRFVFGLEQVPEDRLTFKPSETSASPLEVAGKMAGFTAFLGQFIAEGTMPDRSGGPKPAPASREAALEAVNGGFAGMVERLGALSDEDLNRSLTMPWGTVTSARDMLWGVPAVVGYWQGQLNYLQTVYGDMEPNIPPSWFPSKD